MPLSGTRLDERLRSNIRTSTFLAKVNAHSGLPSVEFRQKGRAIRHIDPLRAHFRGATMNLADPVRDEYARHEDVLKVLISRARNEFLEMPGLCVTSVGTARLLGIDRTTAECILHALTASGFLVRSAAAAYPRAAPA